MVYFNVKHRMELILRSTTAAFVSDQTARDYFQRPGPLSLVYRWLEKPIDASTYDSWESVIQHLKERDL